MSRKQDNYPKTDAEIVEWLRCAADLVGSPELEHGQLSVAKEALGYDFFPSRYFEKLAPITQMYGEEKRTAMLELAQFIEESE